MQQVFFIPDFFLCLEYPRRMFTLNIELPFKAGTKHTK